MSSNEKSALNIKNALEVISKTYENINKLMEYCKTVACEKTNYTPAVTKFLRYKSDLDCDGWLISDFILLFQNKADAKCQSGNNWLDGCVYVMEICLGEDKILPTVFLSKFVYEDINSWSEGCSPANHWAFYYPIRRKDLMDITNENGYRISRPKNKKNSETYWGLKKAITSEIPLLDLNADNLQNKIFGEFDRLSKIK